MATTGAERYLTQTPEMQAAAILSLALATLMVFAYGWALGPLGRLLHRRETKILAVITAEVE